MPVFRQLTVAVLIVIGASVPVATYSGYLAPVCTYATVWTITGYHYQYVCF